MRAADVPAQWWDDPALCIERYISNHQDRWHRAYVWRDRLCLREAINPALVKKSGGNVSIREFRFALIDGRYRTNAGSDPGPAGLLEQLAVFVPAIGLQFGAVDAVSNDTGEHYIIDVNSTPFFATRSAETLEHLGGA